MGEGALGDAQALANKIVDDAQELGNQAVDLGEEAVSTILGDIFAAAAALMKTAENLSKAAVGK